MCTNGSCPSIDAHLWWGEVDFVQQEPVALLHRERQLSLHKRKGHAASRGGGGLLSGSDVRLQGLPLTAVCA